MELENTHGILVKAVAATNTKPNRILIKSQRFPRNQRHIYQSTDFPIYIVAAIYLANTAGHKIKSFNEVINPDGTTYGYVLHSDTFEKII